LIEIAAPIGSCLAALERCQTSQTFLTASCAAFVR
jgi:hypothetical protein